MKAETFYLRSLEDIKKVSSRLLDIIPNGKIKVVFSNAGSKSSKQRGLQWTWYNDVAKAGIGGAREDTDNGVHLVSKYRWALPILQRDDNDFSDLYDLWFNKYENDPERLEWFVDTQVSTEGFSTSQMAEYLTNFQQHYLKHGVNLTDPQGLM